MGSGLVFCITSLSIRRKVLLQDLTPKFLPASDAYLARLKEGNDVSAHTKNAQAIAKDWRNRVFSLDPDRYQIEVLVSPEFDQRIDVWDKTQKRVYEFKVSGKNAPSEFYKDIVKVLLWNDRRKDKIETLVFITERSFGQPLLDKPMPNAYIK